MWASGTCHAVLPAEAAAAVGGLWPVGAAWLGKHAAAHPPAVTSVAVAFPAALGSGAQGSLLPGIAWHAAGVAPTCAYTQHGVALLQPVEPLPGLSSALFVPDMPLGQKEQSQQIL